MPVRAGNLVRSGKEGKALLRARRAQIRRVAWLGGSGVVAAFGAFAWLLTLGVLALATPGWFASLTALATATVPLVLALYGVGRARAASRELNQSLDEAWLLVAREVVEAQTAPATPETLADAMGIDEEVAERLLGQLSVRDVVRARVTADGGLEFDPAGRVRVASSSHDELPDDEAFTEHGSELQARGRR